MNSHLPPNTPSQILDRLENSDGGRVQWNNLHYDYEQFCQEYRSTDWLRRKVVALPEALYAVTFKLVYQIATTLFAGMRDGQRPRLERVRIYGKLASFYGARSLQEGAATIIRLFHDHYGCYLLEKNRLEIAGYDYVRENYQRQRNGENGERTRLDPLRPLIISGHLPLHQALTMAPLSEGVMEELAQPFLRDLIQTGTITFEMAVIVVRSPRHPRWQENFSHPLLRQFIKDEPGMVLQTLLLEPLIEGRGWESNLQRSTVRDLLREGVMTLQEAVELPPLTFNQETRLRESVGYARALSNSFPEYPITPSRALSLSTLTFANLRELSQLLRDLPKIRQLIDRNVITLGELSLAKQSLQMALFDRNHPFVSNLCDHFTFFERRSPPLTLEQMIQLPLLPEETEVVEHNLHLSAYRSLIFTPDRRSTPLFFAELFDLPRITNEEVELLKATLSDPEIGRFVAQGVVALKELLPLLPLTKERLQMISLSLRCEPLMKLMRDRSVTLDQLLHQSPRESQLQKLYQQPFIERMIRERMVTLDKGLHLPTYSDEDVLRFNHHLSHPSFRQLVEDGCILFEEAMALPYLTEGQYLRLPTYLSCSSLRGRLLEGVVVLQQVATLPPLNEEELQRFSVNLYHSAILDLIKEAILPLAEVALLPCLSTVDAQRLSQHLVWKEIRDLLHQRAIAICDLLALPFLNETQVTTLTEYLRHRSCRHLCQRKVMTFLQMANLPKASPISGEMLAIDDDLIYELVHRRIIDGEAISRLQELTDEELAKVASVIEELPVHLRPQAYHLTLPTFRKLLANGSLHWQKALTLPLLTEERMADLAMNLLSLRHLVEDKTITVEWLSCLPRLNENAVATLEVNLSSASFRTMVETRALRPAEVVKLPQLHSMQSCSLRDNLKNGLRACIDRDLITIEEAIDLPVLSVKQWDHFASNSDSINLRALIQEGAITLAQACTLPRMTAVQGESLRHYLGVGPIRLLVHEQKIKVEQAISFPELNEEEWAILQAHLDQEELRKLLLEGVITLEELVALPRCDDEVAAIFAENLRRFELRGIQAIRRSNIPLVELMNLPPLGRQQAYCFSWNLRNHSSFSSLIKDGTITLGEAITLPMMTADQPERLRCNLQRPDLRALIGDSIAMRDVAALTELRDEEWHHLRINLDQPSFRAIIQGGMVTLEELKLLPTLTVTQSEDLAANLFPATYLLVQMRVITLADLLRYPRLNERQRQNLANQANLLDFIGGRITFQQAMDRQLDLPQMAVDRNSQNTHTQSVHASATASAIALAAEYEQDKRADQLALLRNELASIPEGLFDFASEEEKRRKFAAAQRCMRRMIDPNYQDHTDSRSGVSNKRLLALIHVALTQRNRAQTMSAEGKKALVEALYEIQRGYNLDSLGRDNGVIQDFSICGGGTFNKLIERCVGLIPECQIRFVTEETANLRFRALVIEKAMEYLTVSGSSTEEEVDRKRGLIREIRTDYNSVETIAPFLRVAVEEEMATEFAELWQGERGERRFRELIDTIHEVEIPLAKLDLLEANLQSH